MLRLSALVAALLLTTPSFGQDWAVDHDASSVAFETEAFGGLTRGEFQTWSAEIHLDPDNLEAARISARVTTASGATGNASVDDSMLSASGLAPAEHEHAYFASEDIRATDAGYAAHGLLSIRGQDQPAILAFTLAIQDNRAVADGEIDIARADFGVGDSSWGDVAAEVRVVLHIEADAPE